MTRTHTYVIDDASLMVALEAFVAAAGTQGAAADALGISSVYLGDVLKGRRPVSALAGRLGYVPLTVFVPDSEPMIDAATAARVIEKLRQRRLAEKAVA